MRRNSYIQKHAHFLHIHSQEIYRLLRVVFDRGLEKAADIYRKALIHVVIKQRRARHGSDAHLLVSLIMNNLASVRNLKRALFIYIRRLNIHKLRSDVLVIRYFH